MTLKFETKLSIFFSNYKTCPQISETLAPVVVQADCYLFPIDRSSKILKDNILVISTDQMFNDLGR